MEQHIRILCQSPDTIHRPCINRINYLQPPSRRSCHFPWLDVATVNLDSLAVLQLSPQWSLWDPEFLCFSRIESSRSRFLLHRICQARNVVFGKRRLDHVFGPINCVTGFEIRNLDGEARRNWQRLSERLIEE